MSKENVELVRRWGEALSRGDLPLELSHPELRLDNIAEFPNTGPYHGHKGLRRWWQDVAEAFDELRFEIERLIDVDDERVLSVQLTIGRFRHTGIPIDKPLGFAVLGQGRQDRTCRRLPLGEAGTQSHRAAGVGDCCFGREATLWTSSASRPPQVWVTKWLELPSARWQRTVRTGGAAEIAAAQSIRLRLEDDPASVPLETLPGRDHSMFPAG